MIRSVALAVLSLALFAASLAAEAQQTRGLARIGILSASRCPGSDSPFLQGLRDLGYIEGRNITIECRAAEGRYERLPGLAVELVQLKVKVEVLFTPTHPDADAAKAATRTVPIVMVVTGDPVAHGLVASLARPGGNITGLHYYATELSAKRLELLKETVPGLLRVAVLAHPATAYLTLPDTEHAARVLGLQLQVLMARDASEFDGVFTAMLRERAGALLVLPDVMFSMHGKQLADLAAKHRLPSMYAFGSLAQAGGLMAYGANTSVLARRAAYFVDKILKGAKPADLPVEQPTKFEFVLNMRTAKTLGLTIPPSILI
ncbi:MAG: ABC transporter substrate-binding protein, partial [Actinomycetota bacterium]